MTWSFWTILAFLLLVAELGTPGFFMVFFAAGALCTAATAALWPDAGLSPQLGIFAVTSTAALLLFRRRLIERLGPDTAPRQDELVQEVAIPVHDLAPDAVGKAELRGTVWTARNASDAPLAKGQRCRVTRVDGLTLLLVAEPHAPSHPRTDP
jgi:membrane protein implicated in regulation of membrane protease activity